MNTDDNREVTHTTQPSPMQVQQELIPINEQLDGARRVEGGVHPNLQKADFSAMPRPVRWFGYFFMAAVVGLLVFSMMSNWLK